MGWGGGDASAFGIIAKSFRATDAFLPDREQRRGAFSVLRGPPLCDVSARPETMALGDCLSTMTNALDVEDGGVVDFPNGTHEKKISAVELGDFPHRGNCLFRPPFLFVRVCTYCDLAKKKRKQKKTVARSAKTHEHRFQ